MKKIFGYNRVLLQFFPKMKITPNVNKKWPHKDFKLEWVFQFPLDLQTAFAFGLSEPVVCDLWGS